MPTRLPMQPPVVSNISSLSVCFAEKQLSPKVQQDRSASSRLRCRIQTRNPASVTAFVAHFVTAKLIEVAVRSVPFFSKNLGLLTCKQSPLRFFGQHNAIAEPHRFSDTEYNPAIEQPRSMRRFLASENRAGIDNRTSGTSEPLVHRARSPLLAANRCLAMHGALFSNCYFLDGGLMLGPVLITEDFLGRRIINVSSL